MRKRCDILFYVIRFDNYHNIRMMSTQCCGLYNTSQTNIEPKNLMELNLISHYLFFLLSCVLLNRSPSLLQRKLSSPMKCRPSFFLQLQNLNFAKTGRSFFSLERLGRLIPSMGMSLYPSRGTFVRWTYYFKNCVIWFYESPLKIMKNVFISPLFVLKIFKILS